MNITSWLRHCAICNSSFPPIHWLCSRCFKKLTSYYLKPSQMLRLQSHFRHCRLIDWTQENDHFIRTLLYSLKGKYDSPFFKILAREFCIRIQQIQSISTEEIPFILVPCPPRPHSNFLCDLLNIKFPSKKEWDHSFYWSQSIKDWTGYPISSLLEFPPRQKAQKRKSLLERKNRFFTLKDHKVLPQGHLVVFTDDIVTSGTTAHAVYQALGRPEPFMIWSIFWRKFKQSS